MIWSFLLLDKPSLGITSMMVAEVGRSILDINKNKVTVISVKRC